jgi:glycosyltransferase involved in cell wall biosynthesis
MRIGFDAKRAFRNNTGLGNYSRFIINGLADFFPENNYFLYSNGYITHSELTTSANTETINIGNGVLGTIKRAISYGNTNLDILHGLSNELPFFAKNGKTKLIVSIHDLLFIRYPEFYPFFDRQIYLAKTKRACVQADVIIAISEQTKLDLIEFLKIPESKIIVHYQSCHPQFWTQYSEVEIAYNKAKYGITKPYILQVGTLENRKNALLTLQAFNNSILKNDFQLVFLGKKTAYCEVLYQFVSQHKLSDKILFIHQSDFLDFPLLYQGAELSVYPSLFEGFGIPVLEAMCSNVPLITSKDGCFVEVGGDAAVYIDPKNADELQNKMENILINQDLRLSLIEKGRIQKEKFAPQKLIQELSEIYKSL